MWHPKMGAAEARDSAADAFREALGWGAGGRRGLPKYPGFKTPDTCWKCAVQQFGLHDAKQRKLLRTHHVLPYCAREGIVLEGGETLLQYFERLRSYGGQELTLCPRG